MATQHHQKAGNEIVPFILVVTLALLVWPVRGAMVNNNSAKWLVQAKHVISGNFPESTDKKIELLRRPVFLSILAAGFMLDGESVESASLATRAFFALEIVLVYLLGRIFYNIWTGLLASFLVLTSYGMNLIAGSIDTDIVLPFFILLFIIFFSLALTRSKCIWAILSGISLGLALGIKLSSVFCLGLPLGLIILAPKGEKWKFSKMSFIVIGTLIIALMLGAISVFFYTQSFQKIYDVVISQYKEMEVKIIYGGIWTSGNYLKTENINKFKYLFSTGFPKTIHKFYKDYLLEVTPLAWAAVIGWLFVFFRGIISKKIPDLVLIVSTICFLPFVIRTADYGDRIGQISMVYLLFYIILSIFIVSSLSWIIPYLMKWAGKYLKSSSLAASNPRNLKILKGGTILATAFLLIGLQLFAKDASTWEKWTQTGDLLAIFSKKEFEVYGRFTLWQKQAAEWLKYQKALNSRIMADGFTHEALDFYGEADYDIPIYQPIRAISPADPIPLKEGGLRPLFFLTYSNFESGEQRTRGIFPIFEEDIINALRKENPDYLVISGRGLFLKAYFDRATWATLKYENDRARIYEIRLDQFEPVIFPSVGVNETIIEHLSWLEKNYPDEYRQLEQKIEVLNLTVDKLKNSPLRFPKEQTY